MDRQVAGRAGGHLRHHRRAPGLPFVLTVWYSLLRWNLLRPDNLQFADIDNYLFVVSADPVFWSALVQYDHFDGPGSVILALVLGLLPAELVDPPLPGSRHRPHHVHYAVSDHASRQRIDLEEHDAEPGLWRRRLLDAAGQAPAVDWLAQFPLTAITGMVVWRWAPFMMLILLAGMQSLSEEIREAARVDGVSGIQEFRYIVLPHLNRFIQLGALLGSVYIVQEFDSIYMTTQGGPGTSSTNLPFLSGHEPSLVLRLAVLLHDIGKPATRVIEPGGAVSFHHHDVLGAKLAKKRLRALRFDNATIEGGGRAHRAASAVLRIRGRAVDATRPSAATCATPAPSWSGCTSCRAPT